MISNFSITDPIGILTIFFAMFLGGILKGVTGSGMPIIAVPVIAAFYDVRLAVIVLVIPNLLINTFQVYKFRSHNIEKKFTAKFAFSGLVGAALGTIMLSWLPIEKLNILMALILLLYIGLRISKPSFHIPLSRAHKLVWYAGLGGGFLQGALGISAPIAVTFANAIKLNRPVHIFTISVFFSTMCLIQIPLLIAYGFMTWQIIIIGFIACIPIMLGLSVGDILGKRMNAIIFDRVTLLMLTVLAFKQIISVLL